MEKTYTVEELQEIQQKGSEVCHCWKTRDKTCILKYIDMYEHDGGVFVEGKKEKQWVYFTCSRCNYQWALHKVLHRIERAKR